MTFFSYTLKSYSLEPGFKRPFRSFPHAPAHVNLNADGTVTLTVGSVDVSGTRTKMAQVVAEEFGIPFEKVTIATDDSETVPFLTLCEH